jgi:N-acetyl-anhydromuramyl-L-alanine amidase AmpD
MIIERLLTHGGGKQNPKRIVVHCMSEEVEYEGKILPAWELLDALKLSAHVLIYPDGTRVRCRADNEMAWHAKGFNTDSLGVEILVSNAKNLDELQRRTKTAWVSPEQMNSLVQQIMIWKKAYPIEKIDRHSDLDPARKWFDPGDGFPWTELLQRTWI